MKRSIFILIIGFSLFNCARRGNPTGGPKDKDAPIIIQTFPKFNTTDFNQNEIKIYFDEYVKVKDLQKQLIVSPPLKYPAQISPQGMATKRITIKIKDTLKPNTTYVFNFGNSIEDNNEGNILSNFKYVFSTGKVIDSLTLSGKIKDAFNQKTDKFVSVMLYKWDENFKDSIIYKEKPDYLTSTLDSTFFKLTNLKEGTYKIIALKESNVDYIYQPKNEKIAFLDTLITLPTDKELLLNLFKQEPSFKITKTAEISKGHLLFGYEGFVDKAIIKAVKLDSLKRKGSISFEEYQYKESTTDTIHYFYVYDKLDSIGFVVEKDSYNDYLSVKLHAKKQDSLTFKSSVKGILHPLDTLTVHANIPIKKVDLSKFKFVVSDSIPVDFTTKINKVKNLQIIFEKQPKSKYNLQVLPKGITSVFKQDNDTLHFNFQTKKQTYYGSIKLLIKTKQLPIIVQLLNKNNKIVQQKYLVDNPETTFESLVPDAYTIRVIVDKNKNRRWDSGNIIKQIQPEAVYYHPAIKVKENFYLNQTMELK